MITKLFQFRDRSTNIPVMATRLDPGCERDQRILARAGYGRSAVEQSAYIFLATIAGGDTSGSYDAYSWPRDNRTLREGHKFLLDHFDELASGSVIDVQFILGETTTPKEFE